MRHLKTEEGKQNKQVPTGDTHPLPITNSDLALIVAELKEQHKDLLHLLKYMIRQNDLMIHHLQQGSDSPVGLDDMKDIS